MAGIKGGMPMGLNGRNGLVLTQLATRVPKKLHQAVRVHCVRNDLSVMDFVVQALEARLRAKTARA
jgi:predicted HicB family RNase H-like nuclease